MPLTPDEVESIRLHARNYAGPFTPTYQRLAAAVVSLAEHIQGGKAMADDESVVARDHILRGAEELKRSSADRQPAASVCQTCRWWDPISDADGERGLCRASLPISTSEHSVWGEWLQTGSRDWCRHHEPAKPHPLRVFATGADTAGGG
jgi:hypothetical protein